MTVGHEQDKHEVMEDPNVITNQPSSTVLEDDQQSTAAVPMAHIGAGSLLSQSTRQVRARKGRITFCSLPREIRDMIWSEVLGPEDDIFQANLKTSIWEPNVKATQTYYLNGLNLDYHNIEMRHDGSFNKNTWGPILLSSCPPLPLAHLCQESRDFALKKYNAAYSKVKGSELNQERGRQFRWLSRSAARLLPINIDDADYDKTAITVPLGEDEPLMLLRHRADIRSWRSTGNPETDQGGVKRNAFLELLKKAKDYQIMLSSNIKNWSHYSIDRNIAQKWGVFADRAPGQDFLEDRATKRIGGVFVEARDIFPMVQLLRDINMRGRTVDVRQLGLKDAYH